MRSAAWRISSWATLAFTCGTMIVFVFLDRFVSDDIQRRSDAWLTGEVEVLADVSEHTPDNALYNRVVGEVAELASHEVPNREADESNWNDSVFFLQTSRVGAVKLWVGAGDGQSVLTAIASASIGAGKPTHLRVRGFRVPFRVATITLADGSRVYLGLSERDQMRVLRNLRLRFALLWFSLVLLCFGVVFYASRRILSHVRRMAEAASRIGQQDLETRLPTSSSQDEMAQLAVTLNVMLDRIQNTVNQLHTMTDSLAHDLRSPLTAIRGKLETSLAAVRDGEHDGEHVEQLVAAIEELDRLNEFLNTSLDVAEARADALRLTPTEIDLDALLRSMIALYEPSMSERGIEIVLRSAGPARIVADQGLIHRTISNLFDNELKHLPSSRAVTVTLESGAAEVLLTVEDDGAGFDAEVLEHLFARRVKGRNSRGHGIGLAFVDAVVRAHAGSITAANAPCGGARVVVRLPVAFHPTAQQNAASSSV
jgi:signal transduction histidine kinase